MNGPNSWEVDSYQEGKWRISVRHNLENDRLDEGDFPEASSQDQQKYHVLMDNRLVAEVKGTHPLTRKIIPTATLSSYDEDQLHQFLDRKPLNKRGTLCYTQAGGSPLELTLLTSLSSSIHAFYLIDCFFIQFLNQFNE